MASPTDQGIAEGVRWLLEQQTLVRAPLPAPLPTPISGAGGTPTVVIAAYNCTLLSQNKADLFCTGVNDDGTFLVALSILQSKLNDQAVGVGGRIVLTEGDFYFSSELRIIGTVKIEGMGMQASIIHIAGGANSNMFHLASPYSSSFELISVGLDGAKADQTAGTSSAILFDPNAGTGELSLTNVRIYDFTGNGLTLDRAACQFSMVSCLVETNSLVGVHLFVEGSFHISNSRVANNGTIGISANGAALELFGNVVEGNGTHGFSAGGIFESTQKLIFGNAFVDNGGDGILWDGVNGVIVGNFCNDNGQYGIELFGNEPLIVTNNVITGNTFSGALLQGGAGEQGGIFANNTVKLNMQHGIHVAGDHWSVNGNRVDQNSQQTTNTFDGIFLDANADECEILCNKIREAAGGPAMRYGIHVVNGAINNQVAGNRVHGTFGTAHYNLVDASTIQVWAGATGDNQ